MKKYKVWFYLEGERKDHSIRDWLKREGISVAQIASFQEKIDTLEEQGPHMVPGFISETPVAKGIYKMKIKGNKGMKQLRPMCCRGPFEENEYTILLGAIEKGNKLEPKDCKSRAQKRLEILKKDKTRRTDGRLIHNPEEGI